MPLIYSTQNNKEILSQPVPESERDVGGLGYVSDAMQQARIIFRLLKMTAEGIAMVKTSGQKAYGLLLLELSRDLSSDLRHIALFRAMIEKAGLPFDLKCIDISDDNIDHCARHIAVEVPPMTVDDVMAGLYHSLESIIIDGRSLGDDASPSVSSSSSTQDKTTQQI